MFSPIRCPKCQAAIGETPTSPQSIHCSACNSDFHLDSAEAGVATLSYTAPPPVDPGVASTMPFLVDATASWTGSLKSRVEHPPLRVGRFEIRRELGEGAFGKVYQAYDGQLDRVVALKVAKLDRDVEHRVKRFLREAKSAANLRHPHIVPLFEFGQEDNVFYLVSAFIDGRTLQSRLAGQKSGNPKFPMRQAAEIVRRLAEALAYAHGQGIVHRDVKPGNVMLDPQDQPILLDFGLATRQEEAEQLTYDGQVLGTPLYMAPEQAKGKDGKSIPESDQYALGVMLYELIAGTPPFHGTAEMVMFHHMQSDLPSPRQKNAAVPRDLETICQKCLEKDAARRYSSCQMLADDLRRWQEGEPIAARRAGGIERTTRWCRKNPLSASLMGAVAVSLVLGIVVSAAFALQSEANARQARANELTATQNEAKEKQARLEAQSSEAKAKKSEKRALESETKAKSSAKQAEESAQQEKLARRQAERVGVYLRDLFAANDPQGLGLLGLRSLQEKGQTLTARELLDRGARQVETELGDEPLTRAALMDMIGEVYRTMGLYDSAKPLLDESLKLRRAGLPPEHPDLADTLTHLGSWHLDKGFFVKAEDYYREALPIRERQKEAGELAASDLLLRWSLAKTFLEHEDAPDLAKRALDIRLKRLGNNHRDVAIAKTVWAATLYDSGKPLQAAIPSLEAITFLLEEASPDKEAALKAVTEFQKAMTLFNLRQYSWAEGALRTSVGQFQKLLGKDHVYNAIPLYELGNSLALQGKYAEAEPIWLECLSIVRKTTGLEHPRAITLIESLSDLYARKKQADEGRKLWKETVEAQESRYGTDYPWRTKTLMKRGKFEAEWGDVHEAERIAREVMGILDDRQATLHLHEVISLQNMGMALGDFGDLDLVREIYHYVIDCESQKAAATPTRDSFATLNNFGDILVCRGQFLEAEPYLYSAIKLAGQTGIFGTGQYDATLAPYNLGRVAWAKGDFAAAEERLRATAKSIGKSGDANDENSAAASLVQLLIQREEFPKALQDLPLLAKSSRKNSISQAAYSHVETLLHVLGNDQTKALESYERGKKLLAGGTNTEAVSYILRSGLAVADSGDAEAARKTLATADAVLALQPKLISALHVKAVSHLRLKQRQEAIAVLQQAKIGQVPPYVELCELIIAQAALQDEANPDRKMQFQAALDKADAACRAHRENKDPLERRYASWYWLDLRCVIAEGRKLKVE